MRNLFLAAIGALIVAGGASAQPSAAVAPPKPMPLPSISPAAAASAPIIQTGGGGPAFRGDGCASGDCGKKGFVMQHAHAPANNCQLGYPCANGCGGVRSDLAFQFGSCKNFFSPCGPQASGLWGHKCPSQPFNTPWGQGWHCPRGYDSYSNH